jgi:hypothetical protein
LRAFVPSPPRARFLSHETIALSGENKAKTQGITFEFLSGVAENNGLGIPPLVKHRRKKLAPDKPA